MTSPPVYASTRPLSHTGMRRRDLVPALSLCGDGDDVSFQWCQKPPYEQFYTFDLASLSSSESVEAVLKKYKVRGAADNNDDPLAAASSSIASFAQSEMDTQASSPRLKSTNEEMMDKARMVASMMVAEQRRREQQVDTVQARAVTYKTSIEAENKKKEIVAKNARQEQRAALHRIPNSRERKLAEKRRRKKYIAIQMQR